MESIWLSYLPQIIGMDLLDHPGASPLGRELRFDAVALFADVTGFTAMSEALGAAGRAGAEELTVLLNSYFAPTIDLIHSYGGSVGKFGGDSLMVIFRADDEGRPVVARRALRCALEMQASIARYQSLATSAGSFSLALRVGLAAGPVFCTSVGIPSVRLEYLFAGSVLQRAARAEEQARPGEVVADAELLALLEPDEYRVYEVTGDRLQGTGEGRGSRLQVIGEGGQRSKDGGGAGGQGPMAEPTINAHDGVPHSSSSPSPWERGGYPLAGDEMAAVRALVAPYLHPAIAQLLQTGQSGFLNEHRKVVVVFVNFSGFDYDGDPQAGARLRAYFAEVVGVVERYDGYLKQIDVGDKGSKYMVLFGAPVAHEDDAARALRCALDLYRVSAAAGVVTRTGIAAGYVYCGHAGAPSRQEYTAIGDAVNLAARLMQAASPEQILVDQEARQLGGELFSWERLEQISVKGRSEPVVPYALYEPQRRATARLPEAGAALPLIGRERELARADELLAQVLAGQGAILGVTAEAGVGKSRLLVEIMRRAARREMESYSGECLSYATSASYLVWQPLLRGLFGVEGSWDFARQNQQLVRALLEMDPQAVQRVPLLGLVLNVPIAETDLTRGLDPQQRKAGLEDLVVSYVRHRAAQAPLLLVLENCHWIDPLSHDLLEAICAKSADLPLLVLAAYRPPETERVELRVSRMRHFEELLLEELRPEDAERLIRLKLDQLFVDRAPLPALIARILERAQGNPFYIHEMVSFLHSRRQDPSDPRVLARLELPDSLQSLIISRIDQLEEGPRTTLKVASVIGRVFKASWLSGAHPQLGMAKEVREHLATLSLLELMAVERSEPELECFFKHALTREVAYASLSVATRSMLHEQVARFIERSYPDELDRYVDLLAYHYGQSQQVAKQRDYFLKAGQAAQAAFANESAVDYYLRLLPLLPPQEHGRIQLEVGRIYQLIGRWPEAEEVLRQALELAAPGAAGADALLFAEAESALGYLFFLKTSYFEALEWLERARRSFEALGEPVRACLPIRLIGNVHAHQGDYVRALERFEECRRLAEAGGDLRESTLVLANIGNVYVYQADYRRALASYEQWLKVAFELGDRRQVGSTIGNMGIVYWYLGDPRHALSCFEEQLAVASDVGDRRMQAIAMGNMAQVYFHHGAYELALLCSSRQLQIALEIGNRQQVALALGYGGRTLLAQDRHEEAARCCERANRIGSLLNLLYYICEFYLVSAELALARDRLDEAEELVREAQRVARSVQRKDILCQAELLGLRLRARRNPADATLRPALEALAANYPGDEERAAISYERWRLEPASAELRAGSARLYQALYEKTPHASYAQRYLELAGRPLPPPPALPDLPPLIGRGLVDLGDLLAQVDELILGS